MITASIVLYNTKIEYVNRVVESYQPSKEKVLYIVDNSEIKSREYDKRAYVHYIFLGKNIGYGAAHNIAIDLAMQENSEYHVVLNPDIAFEPNIIDELKNYADKNEDVVYMMPKVLYPNGELQYLCKLLPTPFDLIFRRFFPQIDRIKKRNDRYVLKESGYNKIMNPPCLSGCFMFMRVSSLKKYELLFDERFFMYCEDFDLIRRLHRIGKTIFYPKVSIVHTHEKSSYKNIGMLLQHIKSAYKYFNKYGWFRDAERDEMNKEILINILE